MDKKYICATTITTTTKRQINKIRKRRNALQWCIFFISNSISTHSCAHSHSIHCCSISLSLFFSICMSIRYTKRCDVWTCWNIEHTNNLMQNKFLLSPSPFRNSFFIQSFNLGSHLHVDIFWWNAFVLGNGENGKRLDDSWFDKQYRQIREKSKLSRSRLG